jgi:hypothetical protein
MNEKIKAHMGRPLWAYTQRIWVNSGTIKPRYYPRDRDQVESPHYSIRMKFPSFYGMALKIPNLARVFQIMGGFHLIFHSVILAGSN